MASLKSLMSQRKAAARLDHPFAKYDHAGRLSCSICGLQLKHENLWSAHLVSKQHRVNAQTAASASDSAMVTGLKRKREDEEEANKRPKSALPDDFFDGELDAEKAPVADQREDDDEDDPEWAAFEAELAKEEGQASTSGLKLPPVLKSAATVSALPVTYEFGAPKVPEAADEQEEPVPEEETDEQRRERIEREEREEMIERINEEERAQQEADDRVTALQQKLQRIREMRQKRTKQ